MDHWIGDIHKLLPFGASVGVVENRGRRCPPALPNGRVMLDEKQHGIWSIGGFNLANPLSRNQAQTPQQRRANLKFQKDQEARRGKSEDQIKKRVEKAPKSPISMFWLVVLGFVVFGGLVFEVLSRLFLN
ncbi:hypothetical protein B0T20DRAFT_388647 [Sordaria brevicollis]|uniref:Stress-associated endoplasmic reticulum protein n=1 Tax=Sordaria brevicollis TaxID=83679 RepID=A0AAE0UGA1_SORBR|nr:hypothetical protein B0T20DRAFT_388647 [Sordaria brevicollis]